jgi:hypothetical protein
MVQLRATLYDRPDIDNSDLGPQLVNYFELAVSGMNAAGNQLKALLMFRCKQQFSHTLVSVSNQDRTRGKCHAE